MSPEEYIPYNQPNKPSQKYQKVIVLTVIGFVVLLFAWVIYSSLQTKSSTGILEVTVSDAAAEISIQTGETESKTIGKGTVTNRLEPGNYTVYAAKGDEKTAQVVTVKATETTRATLKLQAVVPQTEILPDRASNIYASGSDIYFLFPEKSILYTYRPGDIFGKPYKVQDNNLQTVAWVNKDTLYERVRDEWIVGGSRTKLFQQPEEVAITDSVSFSPSGASAVVTFTGAVMRSAGPGQPHQNIGTYVSDNSRTSIAPDGKVLVYTPRTTNFSAKDKTLLLSDGQDTTLEESLNGIDYVVWSPDSTRFIFSDENGTHIYNLANKTIDTVLTSEIMYPRSFTWTNESNFIFGHDDSVWVRSTSDQSAYKLAGINGNLDGLSQFTKAEDGFSYYFATSSIQNNNIGTIYAISPEFNSFDASRQQSVKDTYARLKNSARPTVTSFQAMKKYGITEDQVNNTVYAIGRFSNAENIKPKNINLDSIETVDRNPVTLNDFVTFNFSIDDRQYAATMEYSLLTKSSLTIKDNAGNVLYESGVIDSMQ